MAPGADTKLRVERIKDKILDQAIRLEDERQELEKRPIRYIMRRVIENDLLSIDVVRAEIRARIRVINERMLILQLRMEKIYKIASRM